MNIESRSKHSFETSLDQVVIMYGKSIDISWLVGRAAGSGFFPNYVCLSCLRRQFHASRHVAKSTINYAPRNRGHIYRRERKAVTDPQGVPWQEALRKATFKAAHNFDYFKCRLDTVENLFAALHSRKRIDGDGVKVLAKGMFVPLDR